MYLRELVDNLGPMRLLQTHCARTAADAVDAGDIINSGQRSIASELCCMHADHAAATVADDDDASDDAESRAHCARRTRICHSMRKISCGMPIGIDLPNYHEVEQV